MPALLLPCSFISLLYLLSNLLLFMFISFLLYLCISTNADSSFLISFIVRCMHLTHGGVVNLHVCSLYSPIPFISFIINVAAA